MRLAILISGNGTTAEAIVKACLEGKISGMEPALILASNKTAGGVLKAARLNIPTAVVDRKKYGKNVEEFGDKILTYLDEFKIDFVSQNGWLPKTPMNVIDKYKGRIVNQHPGALDPGRLDFGGKGMFGARVLGALVVYDILTNANIDAESTVHFVDEHFDEGDIISAANLPIRKTFSATPEDKLLEQETDVIKIVRNLQARFLPHEHQHVIDVLSKISSGNIPSFQRSSTLIPNENIDALEKAKRLAIELFPNG